ncbi:hypothetical protein CN305_11055 [Bacillus cereus]|uniref:hypothetical protein n=1 Tax=Bacillus cereus group TaxID=86661 RepID=UPI000BF32C0F|nr:MULTISPECIES: hypothetical protein [Bacillus cereus group]KAA0744038.1 hypothetical protein DN397_26815 [Bacillus sp. AY1-10]PEW56420.1 hypothetical protein CN443_21050 [Bacillus cereus]PEY98744.1 hypothetical protein CN353_13545 [Bacillus cereus]PFD20035.1 hypothetical protein CN305_11055 [Bacillus cereus]PFM04355.1 hypothetical protein COJ39_25625 [Bacillus cereus]
MSFTEIADMAKIAGAAIGVWGIIKGLGSFYMESSTTNEFDQLFKDKVKRKQINIFSFCQDIFIIALSLFIIPSLYLKFFMPNLITNYAFILEPLYKLSYILVTLLFLILIPISLLPKKHLKANWFNRSIKWLSIIHMFSFMFFYWCFFHVNIPQSNKYNFILIAIMIPLFMSFFYLYLSKRFNKTSQPQYIMEIISEEEIAKLKLIHNFIIDDKRSVFHEKYKEENGTFYVCDFSSKVYLKYSKMKTRKDSSK